MATSFYNIPLSDHYSCSVSVKRLSVLRIFYDTFGPTRPAKIKVDLSDISRNWVQLITSLLDSPVHFAIQWDSSYVFTYRRASYGMTVSKLDEMLSDSLASYSTDAILSNLSVKYNSLQLLAQKLCHISKFMQLYYYSCRTQIGRDAFHDNNTAVVPISAVRVDSESWQDGRSLPAFLAYHKYRWKCFLKSCRLKTKYYELEDSVMKASKASFDSKNSMANVIRLFRISSDMGISDLSDKTGLSRSYICDVESGKKKPSLPTIKRFAEAFGVPYSMICLFDEQQSKHGYPFRKLLLSIVREMDRIESEIQAMDDDKQMHQ